MAAAQNQVPEIVNWSTGCNELNIDLAYDMAVVGDFADKDALLRYFKHPAVQALLQRIEELCASRVSVDYSAP
ncbi:MAG: Dabb family protein [Anaerolineae bacterium]|nr:Dabb family protein [Anaerolineae bacterium]